jgi:Phosphopantetheine attachment site
MQAEPSAALLDMIHDALRSLIASVMGGVTGRSAPAPHVSFFALGASDAEAADLTQTFNAVFGLDLPADTVMRSPTPDALARSIETAWFDGDGSTEELIERLAALADDE